MHIMNNNEKHVYLGKPCIHIKSLCSYETHEHFFCKPCTFIMKFIWTNENQEHLWTIMYGFINRLWELCYNNLENPPAFTETMYVNKNIYSRKKCVCLWEPRSFMTKNSAQPYRIMKPWRKRTKTTNKQTYKQKERESTERKGQKNAAKMHTTTMDNGRPRHSKLDKNVFFFLTKQKRFFFPKHIYTVSSFTRFHSYIVEDLFRFCVRGTNRMRREK